MLWRLAASSSVCSTVSGVVGERHEADCGDKHEVILPLVLAASVDLNLLRTLPASEFR